MIAVHVTGTFVQVMDKKLDVMGAQLTTISTGVQALQVGQQEANAKLDWIVRYVACALQLIFEHSVQSRARLLHAACLLRTIDADNEQSASSMEVQMSTVVYERHLLDLHL